MDKSAHHNAPRDAPDGRRRFLKNTAIATGVVWTTPVVIGALPVAAAQGSVSSAHTFDDGTLQGWVIDNTAGGGGDGLWNISSDRSVSPSSSLHYGNGIGGTYNTGGRNSGTVTSPLFTVPATGGEMTFDVWREIEQFANGTWDELSVTILPGGTPPGTVEYSASIDGGTLGVFEPISIDLAAYAGTMVTVVFAFDTGDANFNDFEGIYVDNITIPGLVPPAGAAAANVTTLNARAATRGFFPERATPTPRELRERNRATR